MVAANAEVAARGRGFDKLPPDVLVATITVPELRRALAAVTTALLREGDDLPTVQQVQPMVEELCRSIPS
jgi:hypothetical protein